MIMSHSLWLGIVHMRQMEAPTIAEVMQSPLYHEELKEALKLCKKKGDVQKQVKKIIAGHRKEVVTEQVFLTDSKTKGYLENASIIIDVDARRVIKNRFDKERELELLDMYLARYEDKIAQFRKQFGKAV